MNRNGLLTGRVHFSGMKVMRELLESEGVAVDDDRVVNLESVFWDPSEDCDLEDYLATK